METLKITSLGTIQSDNGFEMILEKFLKKLERNIKYTYYNVMYNEKDTNFYILFDGEEYVLELDSETKRNILYGKYNNYVSRLMKLSNNQSELYKKCIEIQMDKKKKEKIIEDAEKGILSNDEARVIYLEYLKDLRADVLRAYLYDYIPRIDGNLEEYEEDFLKVSLVFATVGFLIGAGISGNVGSIYPLIGVTGFAFLIPTCFTRLATFLGGDYSLIQTIKQRKIIKHKIKELEKTLNIRKSKSNNKENNYIEDNNLIKYCSYNFKDVVYKEVSNLLDRIDSITNCSDKIELKRNVKSILERYNIGLKEAQKGELGSSDIIALQMRIKRELIEVDAKVDGIIAKDITEVEMKKEEAILEERLGPVVIDSKEIDGVLEDREKNKEPIRVLRKISKGQ